MWRFAALALHPARVEINLSELAVQRAETALPMSFALLARGSAGPWPVGYLPYRVPSCRLLAARDDSQIYASSDDCANRCSAGSAQSAQKRKGPPQGGPSNIVARRLLR